MSPLLILFPWGTLFKSCHLSFTEKFLFWTQGELYLINELWIYLPFLAFVLHSVASLLNWMLFELFHCLVITMLPLTHSSFIKNGAGLHTVNQKKESKRGKLKHQPKQEVKMSSENMMHTLVEDSPIVRYLLGQTLSLQMEWMVGSSPWPWTRSASAWPWSPLSTFIVSDRL